MKKIVSYGQWKLAIWYTTNNSLKYYEFYYVYKVKDRLKITDVTWYSTSVIFKENYGIVHSRSLIMFWEIDRREIFFIRLIVYMKRMLRNGENFIFCKNTSCIRYCYYMKVICTYVQISFVDLTLPLNFMQMKIMHFLILWKTKIICYSHDIVLIFYMPMAFLLWHLICG